MDSGEFYAAQLIGGSTKKVIVRYDLNKFQNNADRRVGISLMMKDAEVCWINTCDGRPRPAATPAIQPAQRLCSVSHLIKTDVSD